MERPLISILVCMLKSREGSYRENLYPVLKKQIDTSNGNAEIKEFCDNGELLIGTKRNSLLDLAAGEYCCFVDDDDMISADYVSEILSSIERNKYPDCVEIRGEIFWAKQWIEFRHSIKYCGWYTNDGIFFRTPNHLNPIRREIAQEVRFKNMGAGKWNVL